MKKQPNFAEMRRIQREAWRLIYAGTWSLEDYNRLVPRYTLAMRGYPLFESFAMLRQLAEFNPYAPTEPANPNPAD